MYRGRRGIGYLKGYITRYLGNDESRNLVNSLVLHSPCYIQERRAVTDLETALLYTRAPRRQALGIQMKKRPLSTVIDFRI